jgi:hypothetical protein
VLLKLPWRDERAAAPGGTTTIWPAEASRLDTPSEKMTISFPTMNVSE